MKNKKHKTAFTLIETVTYLSLISLLFLIIFSAFSMVTQVTNNSSDSIIKNEETAFAKAKINFLVSSAVSINNPSVGQSSPNLTLRISGSQELVQIKMQDGFIVIQRNNGLPEKLHSQYIKISELFFTHRPSQGVVRPSVSYSFKVGDRHSGTSTIEISNF